MGAVMLKNRKLLAVAVLVGGLVGVRAFASPHLDSATAGLKNTIQLLVLMETDGSGKVTKAEFMHFMEAEFDRLDTNKNGELDVKELTQTQHYVHGGVHR